MRSLCLGAAIFAKLWRFSVALNYPCLPLLPLAFSILETASIVLEWLEKVHASGADRLNPIVLCLFNEDSGQVKLI